MLKEVTLKGIKLGLVAGLIVTLFDGLYMLTPNTYVPYSYPLLLITFNIIFWTIIGGLSGFFVWIFSHKIEDFKEKENFCWVLFFLLPFAIIYGLLGRVFIPLYSTTIISASPVFDYHLSIVWASLILFFLIVFKRRFITSKSFAISFIPEITAITALLNFCSNISQIPVFYKFIRYVFFQDSQLSYKEYLTMPQWYLILLYAMGVSLIIGFYFLAYFRVNFLNKKQNRVIVLLCSIVCLSLVALYTVNHNRSIKHNYPTVKQKQTGETQKISSIILIVLDAVRADRLSIYGHHATTKTLEKIAKHSLVFENCVAPSPWTTPSHASLFTGFHPSEHGSINAYHKSKPGLFPTRLAEEFLTLAEIFKNNGYKTGAVVSNSGALPKSFRINQGFQIYNATRNIGGIYRSYSFNPIVHFFCNLTNVYPKFIKHYRTADDINKETFRALNKLIPSPFFLFINYMDAHAPYFPPRPFNQYFSDTSFPHLHRLKQKILGLFRKEGNVFSDSFILSQYDGEIAYLDHHLGKLFSKLKEKKLYNSSLIIVTSDHGELFGEHGLHFHGTPMYEEALKVPLIIKFPFNRRVGYEKEMITLTDLYPTILSICDLPIPDNISGKSFGRGSSPIVSEFYNYGIGEHRILYDKDYKYMIYQQQRKPELYNLRKDPLEQVNQSEKLPDITVEMNKKLEEWIKRHKPRYDKDSKATALTREVEEGLKALGYIK